MSASVKVKVIKSDNKDVSELFAQMLGAGDTININVCYPKYANMRQLLLKLIKCFGMLKDSPLFKKWPEHQSCISEIEDAIEKAQAEYNEYFVIDFGSTDTNLNLLDDEQKQNFSNAYKKVKELNTVKTFIATCNNLIIYRKYIQDVSALDYRFITTMPGVTFSPFPFTQLNIKALVTDIITENESAEWRSTPVTSNSNQMLYMLLLLLNKIYTLSYNLYQAYSSPDIDVSEFVSVVKDNLAQVKKHIPRCDRAFKKIEESVSLLRENFSDYYKDYISTQSPTTIMENFVLDVAKTTNADGETTRQFREIIKYYKKIAASQIKNPQLKMLFDKVNENFKELEKHQNLSKGDKELKEERLAAVESDSESDEGYEEDPRVTEAKKLLLEK